VFLLFGVIKAIHHEMWRDEVEAWLIAKDSSSSLEIMKTLKYFGQPALWFFCLFPLTRITSSPEIMQAFNLLIACIALYLFAQFAPFTWLHKILFAFGYFLFYEYSVISRMYALSVLLIFLFCILFPKRYDKFVILSITIFLLAHSSVPGLIIAIAFFITLIFDFFFVEKRPVKIKAIIAFFIIILGIVSSIIQIIPHPDYGIAVGWHFRQSQEYFIRTLTILYGAFFPVPFFSLNFWNTNILKELPFAIPIQITLGILMLFYGFVVLLKRLTAFFMFVIGTLGLLVFFYIKYLGSIRHHGFIFLLFVSAIWISHYCRETKRIPRFFERISSLFNKGFKAIFAILLLIHVIGGIGASYLDYIHAFSQGKATARFIKQKNLDKLLLVGDTDNTLMPISGYLGKKIYYPRGDQYGSFVLWNKKRIKPITGLEVVQKAESLSREHGKDCLIIMNRRLRKNIIAEFSLIEVGHSWKAVVVNEVYFLYILRRKEENGLSP